MIALILLQAVPTVTVVPVVTPIPELTPASYTKPIEHFDCRVISEAGSPQPLVIRREGLQGYVDVTTLSDKPFVSRTPITYRILEDGTGILKSMQNWTLGSWYGELGHRFRDDGGNVAVLKAGVWNDNDTKSVVSLYFYPKGMAVPQVFAGPCTVKRIEQKPLDHAPEGSAK